MIRLVRPTGPRKAAKNNYVHNYSIRCSSEYKNIDGMLCRSPVVTTPKLQMSVIVEVLNKIEGA